MPYSAASIANAFLNRAFGARGQNSISPMKLQKLVYLAHGHTLAETGEPLLDEAFEAWKFGPVLPSLYHECKRFGGGTVRDFIHDYDLQTEKYYPAPVPDDGTIVSIIDFVWKTYGNEDALSLSDWTHAKNGPWDQVTSGGQNILRNQDIPNKVIRQYFLDNLDAEAAEAP